MSPPRRHYEVNVSGYGPTSLRRAYDQGDVPSQEIIEIQQAGKTRILPYTLKNNLLAEIDPKTGKRKNPHKSRGIRIETVVKGNTEWKVVLKR